MQYEIEIKSLLASQAAVNDVLAKAKHLYPDFTKVGEQHQLNHYFIGGTLAALMATFSGILSADQQTQLQQIADRATSINVRSRQKNDTVLLIVKGSLDATSAVHSHQRMEFEAEVPLSLAELDDLIVKSGWHIEAKWQADRVLYTAGGVTLDTFFTPGYGYLIEFERVVHSTAERSAAHATVVAMMDQLGVSELPNDRPERMFAYYNAHWQDYYGTKKTFTVE